jgi:2,3-bisphosphoglycerate-independent phosphoglycerate mutase
VGLPEGFQGSSEVGHMNMGAGRVVEQEVKRIYDAMASGEFYRNPRFLEAMRAASRPGAALHLMGLVQDEGVHAHQDLMFRILAKAKEMGVGQCWVHFFGDGRDTPPRSGREYLLILEDEMRKIGLGQVATLMGRYYAMDRDKRWALTDAAYAAIVDGFGLRVAKPVEALRNGYAYLNNDMKEVTDEYVPPTVIGNYAGVKDGDAIIHCNYRQDRAISLSQAFVEESYPGLRRRRPKVAYVGLTRYYDEFPSYVMPPISADEGMRNLLGEVLSARGIRQLRIAETQKFKHVTSFFNGKLTKAFPGEDRADIQSQYDPATFASHPEMNAYDVLNELVRRLDDCPYGFILVNWANCDMVGHTGVFDAAVRAVEVVDDCVGRLVEKALSIGAKLLVTADHGNADQMIYYDRIDPDTGKPAVMTSHSRNPVECIYVASDAGNARMASRGKLCDIAPTVLRLMGLAVPSDMTAQCLVSPRR